MMAVAADREDLRRWIFSAAMIAGLHAALVLALVRWHEPITGDEGTEAIVVDLAPYTGPATDSRNDLAPGPEQQEIEIRPRGSAEGRRHSTRKARAAADRAGC